MAIKSGGLVSFVFCTVSLINIVLGQNTELMAQGLNITSSGKSSGPIEIFADDGIEWQQEKNIFIAHGNAKAIRGTVTVMADVLKAYYRDNDGDTDIWRLDAEGSVEIRSPSEVAYGDLAIYDVINDLLVLRGDNVRFIAGADTITARDQIEYWELKKIAVARGDAVAVREDKVVRADVLVGHFTSDVAGSTEVHQIDAFDNVRIKTANETAEAERGVYHVKAGLAVLTGDVKIVREKNILTGCKAEVDLNTNVSKLFSCSGQENQRVQGILQPDKNTNK